MANIKDDKVIAKISADEKRTLVYIAEKLDVPISQIVREGVRARIAELKETVDTRESDELPAAA